MDTGVLKSKYGTAISYKGCNISQIVAAIFAVKNKQFSKLSGWWHDIISFYYTSVFILYSKSSVTLQFYLFICKQNPFGL